jgi:hypothetical protein
MNTGWASHLFAAAAARDSSPPLPPQPHAALLNAAAQYLVNATMERAPGFYEDDCRVGRPVISAAVALLETLLVHRARHLHARADDARPLVDALVSLLLEHEGAAQARSQRSYALHVATWFDVAANADDAARRYKPVALTPDGTGVEPVPMRSPPSTPNYMSECEAALDAYRALLANVDELASAPSVCALGTEQRYLPRAQYAEWTERSAQRAASVANLFDIEYSVPAADTVAAAAQHAAAARQALAPLVANVRALRASKGASAVVCFELSLVVERAHRTYTPTVYDASVTSSPSSSSTKRGWFASFFGAGSGALESDSDRDDDGGGDDDDDDDDDDDTDDGYSDGDTDDGYSAEDEYEDEYEGADDSDSDSDTTTSNDSSALVHERRGDVHVRLHCSVAFRAYAVDLQQPSHV